MCNKKYKMKVKEFIKANWKWITAILLVLILSFGYWRYTKRQAFYERVKKLMEVGIFREKEFSDVDLQTTNIISNKTDRDYYDDIVIVGLKELGIDSVYVSINEITPEAKANFDVDIELKAHIIGRGDLYMVWIDNMGRSEAIEVLSHELIHLVQYHNRDIILEKDYVEWKGTKYSYDEVKNMDYRDRPWETEAFSKDTQLKWKLEKILYKQ